MGLAGHPATGWALAIPSPTPARSNSPCKIRRASAVLGSALLTTAEATLRDRGGTLFEINVDAQDTDARRFYERHGYSNTEPGSTQPLLYYYRELDR
ncbi:MAG: hypothetical protein QOC63_3753 [Mycobacterium sp.]|nr:hypothetical protein [Mycobacterium sp.]